MTGIFRTFWTTTTMTRKSATADRQVTGTDMIKSRKKTALGAFATIALGAMGVAGLWASYALAQTRPGPFTDAQAQAGQAVYAGRCASCHEAGGETIKLIGARFTDAWKTRSTKE